MPELNSAKGRTKFCKSFFIIKSILGYVFFNIRAKCVDKMLGFKVITKLFKIKKSA